jgi:hypothetical protein
MGFKDKSDRGLPDPAHQFHPQLTAPLAFSLSRVVDTRCHAGNVSVTIASWPWYTAIVCLHMLCQGVSSTSPPGW